MLFLHFYMLRKFINEVNLNKVGIKWEWWYNCSINRLDILQNEYLEKKGHLIYMSIFKKNTTKKEIETSLNEIQINLENNYKDLAIKAFKDSSELVERYHNESLIDEKAYGKYKGQLDVFAKRMEGYSHRLNVKY